jgi:hypothetical protein
MRAIVLEDALNTKPFIPFDIVVDGRTIHVAHPEQVLFNRSKSTAVVVPDEHIHIIDIGHVSSLTLRRRNGSRRKAA